MFAVMRQRNFMLLWLSGLISLTGDRAMRVALPVYVYQQTGSTLATAAMAATYYAPAVLLGSLAGVFADRWDRRRIMIITNLIQALVMLLLLLVRSDEWLWLAYVVSFLDASVGMFFQPAESAIVPNLVGEEHLIPANSLGALNNNIARLAGPPVGGILIGLSGLASVAVLNAASFLCAAVLIGLISVTSKPPLVQGDVAEIAVSSWVAVWREWLDGLRLVKDNRLITVLFTVMGITSFGGSMIDPLFNPFVLSVLDSGPAARGWLSTMGALGGLLAGVLMARFGGWLLPRQLTAFSSILAGILMLAVYNQKSLPAAMVLVFLLHIPVVAAGVGSQTMLQTGVPDRYRGRVYGALYTTMALLSLSGVAVAGVLGDVFGVVPMLSTAGCITVLAGVLALVLLPRAEQQSQAAHKHREAPASL